MTVSAPHVYIGRQRMNDLATDAAPLLAGLSFNWGTDSQVDFEDPGTLSAEMLIREPSTLDFLTKGAEFGVVDPGSGETYFAGRITTLRARNHPTKKDALVISITAADTLADLNGYRIGGTFWKAPVVAGVPAGYATSAATRRAQLRAALPAGWTLEGTTRHDWTTAREQRFTAHSYVPILDRHLRSVIGRRHTTSRYVPGEGLKNSITVTDERAKDSPAERLAARSDGTWYMATAAPTNSGFTALAAREVGNSIEWEKTPDDTITDVALSSWGITYARDTETGEQNTEDSAATSDIWVGSHPGVNMGPMQRAHGFHTVSFDVDTLGGETGGGSPHIADIVNYWLDADTQWRPTSLTVPDSRRLKDEQVIRLLSVTRRYLAYVTVDGLPANNPAGGSRVRGYIIAGNAEWTGKKWVIELTLGRVPRPAPGSGALTFTTLKNSATAAINAGTAETIGDALSFADFAYIGA